MYILRLLNLLQILHLLVAAFAWVRFVQTKSLELIDELVNDIPEPNVWLMEPI
jgi:hypothetical protein